MGMVALPEADIGPIVSGADIASRAVSRSAERVVARDLGHCGSVGYAGRCEEVALMVLKNSA